MESGKEHLCVCFLSLACSLWALSTWGVHQLFSPLHWLLYWVVLAAAHSVLICSQVISCSGRTIMNDLYERLYASLCLNTGFYFSLVHI
jgi:uncharacterized membrane protein